MVEARRSSYPEVRRIGRVFRFSLGALLLWMVVPFFRAAEAASIGQVLLLILLLTALYALLHVGVYRFLPGLHPLLGAALALVPAILVFVWLPRGDVAVASFIGLSLLLAGLGGDAGCEVMSIPGLLLRRKTHLACILFTPSDWLESKLSTR